MKKLLFVLALGCSLSAGAQLTVLENGQTVVGSPTSMTKVDSNATLNIWNHNPTSSTRRIQEPSVSEREVRQRYLEMEPMVTKNWRIL